MLKNPVHAPDPVHHISELVERFPMHGNQPAFSYMEKEKIKCVTYSGFTKELKRLLGRRFKGASLAGSLTSQVLFSKFGSGLSTTS